MKPPDRIDAAQAAFVQVLANPFTWLPFAPLAAAYAFIGLPWWLCLPVALAITGALAAAWAKRWPKLMERAHTNLLQTYRQAENAALYERMRQLVIALSHLPTKRLLYDLREAMEIKVAIEKRLFADAAITPHEEEVGEMVADTVRTMIHEAEKAPILDKAQLPRSSEKVEKALESLRRTFDQIDVILDPIPDALRPPTEDADALARAAERLNEKLQQAQGVRRYLERDAVVSDPPPPLPGQAAEER